MKIGDYKDFETYEFIEDDNFRRWVLLKDDSLNFFWEAYLKEYPHKISDLVQAKNLLLATHTFYHTESQKVSAPSDDFSKHLLKEFNSNSSKIYTLKNIAQPKFSRKVRWISAAACFLLVICSVFFITSKNEMIQYTTGNGEWETIELPDGSIVELNANSELSIYPNWEEGKDRNVWITGEAFFQVTKKKSTGAKFFVATSDLKVEVLGTAFSVNTRNSQTEVFLEEGKISLELEGVEEKENIVPGEFIAYSEVQRKVTNRYKKTEEIQADWKDGVLKLDNVSTAEIISEIEAIYGIEVIVNSKSILAKVSSVAIPVNSIEMAILILRRALNVKIHYSKDVIYIG